MDPTVVSPPTVSSGSSFWFEGFLIWTVVGAVWLFYVIFINSRLWGFVVTLVLRKLVPKADVHIGSIAVSILGGKLLFRDVRYITTDFSIRIVDGVIIYRWWKHFTGEQDYSQQDPAPDRDDESQDGFRCTGQSSLDCPLKVALNGFQMHCYNRTSVYDHLESIFNGILNGGYRPADANSCDESVATGSETWRQIVPAVHFHISSGNIAFGNRLVPTALSIHFESGSGLYTTSTASSQLDPFRHVMKMNCKHVKVRLSESEGYSSEKMDAAPRHMGDGFQVAKSDSVKFHYIWDEPGLVPSNSDTSGGNAPPCWSLCIKLGQNTDIMHGPWVRRQRIHLQQFFYPLDYQKAPVTERLLPGMRRRYEAFELDVEATHKMMMSFLFSSLDRVNFLLYVSIDPGSHVHMHLPWVVDDKGYTMTLRADLKHVEATTSLEYRRFAKAEDINMDLKVFYPRQWNQTQEWEWSMTATETTIRFLYIHVPFFQVLLDDWSAGYSPDLLSFIPMTLKLKLTVNSFELLCFVNHFNWLDTEPAVHIEKENAMLAFCGRQLALTTFFPFTEFQPRLQTISCDIQGERVVLRLRVPESRGSYSSIQALIHSNKQHFTTEEVWFQSKLPHRSTSGAIEENEEEEEDDIFFVGNEIPDDATTWRGDTVIEDGWFDCWFAPMVCLQIVYTSHPALLFEDSIQLPAALQREISPQSADGESEWRQEPDHMEVHINVYDSGIRLFGSIAKHFLDFKNNYFGVYQPYHTFSSSELGKRSRGLGSIIRENETKPPYSRNLLSRDDPYCSHPKPEPNYVERQLEVVFSLTGHNNTAQLPMHVGAHGSRRHLPVLKTSSIYLEFRKAIDEGRLIINLSPTRCYMSDPKQSITEQGYLFMSDFQMLGHGFYSDVGPVLVEYGWLIELRMKDIIAEMSTSDARTFVDWLDTFVFHVMDDESDLQPVVGEEEAVDALCDIDVAPLDLSLDETPTINQLKYEFTRVNISRAEIRLLDGECCSALRVSDAFICKCSLHNADCTSGMTVVIHDIRLSQLMTDQLVSNLTRRQRQTAASRKQLPLHKEDIWSELGCVTVPEITVDVSMRHSSLASFSEIQQLFLRHHDEPFRRLWFLWNDADGLPSGVGVDCGCCGGCQFFDSRRPPMVSLEAQVPVADTSGFESRDMRSVSVPRFLEVKTAVGETLSSKRNVLRSLSSPSLLSPPGNKADGPLSLKRPEVMRTYSTVDQRNGTPHSLPRVVSYAESFFSCAEEPIDKDVAQNNSQASPSTDSFASAVDYFKYQTKLTPPAVRRQWTVPPEDHVGYGAHQMPPQSVYLYPKYVRGRIGSNRRTGTVGVAASSQPMHMSRTVSSSSVFEQPMLSFRRVSGEERPLPRLDVIASRHNVLTRETAQSGEDRKNGEEERAADSRVEEEICIAVCVENVDARISPLCTEVVVRHVDCCRRYGHHSHPLRVLDVLHGKLLDAVKYTAMNDSPDCLLSSEDQGNEELLIGYETFRKRRPLLVSVAASLGSATVLAVHDHENQSTQRERRSDLLPLPIAAAAVGGVHCKILRRSDVPSPNSDTTSPSSGDDVLISASLSYVHFQLSAFESTSLDICAKSNVAFEIATDGQRAGFDAIAMPTANTPCVLLEAGAERLDTMLVLSFSPSPLTGEQATESLEGQMSGELSSVWGSLPVPQGKPRQVLSEIANCDVIGTATAVCRQWIDRIERLKESIEKLVITGRERFSKVVSCLLTDALLDSVTKPSCAAMLQPMAFVLHSASAVRLIPVLRDHITRLTSIDQVERQIQESSWSSVDDMSEGMKAVTLAWGGKLHQHDTPSTARGRTRHASSSSLADATLASGVGILALFQTSMFGMDGLSVRSPSLSHSSNDSAGGIAAEPSETSYARRTSRRRSSRLSFYSLFSNWRQTSRVDREVCGNSLALDEMARKQDVLGYAKELLKPQRQGEMVQAKVTLRPLLTVLGIKTDESEQRRSYLLQTNCTVKQVTVLSHLVDALLPPPCTVHELVVSVRLKQSPGERLSGCPSLLDAVGNITIQSIRQRTTVPLLALIRHLVVSSRPAKKEGSFEKSGREQEVLLEDQQFRFPTAQHAEESTSVRGSNTTEPRRDTFTDIMRSLVEVMHETSAEDSQEDVQFQGREDGDGSVGEPLRGGTLAAGAEVVVHIDQTPGNERISLDSGIPVAASCTVSSREGPIPLRPLAASNPLASMSDHQSLLSAPRPSIDSLGQLSWGSTGPLSGMSSPILNLSRTVDDAATASTTSRTLRPPGIRGEGVGESFQNLDTLGVDEDGEKIWQDVARNVKLTSLSESFSCISVSFLLVHLAVEVAVEDVSASLEMNDAHSSLMMKQNNERDQQSDSDDAYVRGDSRVRVCETISFSGVVPSLRLTAADHLDTKNTTLVSGNLNNTGVVVTSVVEDDWRHTVLGVDVSGLGVNFPQSVVALHTAIVRSFPTLSKEAQSMIDITGESGYDEVDLPVRNTRAYNEVVVEGRVQEIVVSAVLLPSLSAAYRATRLLFGVASNEITSFTADVINQQLEFTSKVELEMGMLRSVGLPNVHVVGQTTDASVAGSSSDSECAIGRDRRGRRFDVDVGVDEIVVTLTTDVVKHLAVIQSKFVKETADMLKNFGSLLGSDHSAGSTSDGTSDEDVQPFSVHLKLQGIQVFATTPTLTALRLHTGEIDMTVSNDVVQSGIKVIRRSGSSMLFGVVSVDLKVSLGSHLRTEASNIEEGLFREMAYFHTCVCVKGGEDEWPSTTESMSDKRTLFVEIRRPHLFMQPLAFDKGVLLWLKYKEVLDYWQEQQVTSEIRDLQSAAEVVFDKLQAQTSLTRPGTEKQTSKKQLSSSSVQIKLEDLGLAMPMFANVSSSVSLQQQETLCPVVHLVTTVRSAHLAVRFGVASQPSVSKGEFDGFTVRTDPDFDEEMEQWTLSSDKTVNLVFVPQGEYKVFIQTEATHDDEEGQLNVELSWHMDGVSVMLDSRIGAYLSALVATMTALSSEEGYEYEYESDIESEDESTAKSMPVEEMERGQHFGDTSDRKELSVPVIPATNVKNLSLPPFPVTPTAVSPTGRDRNSPITPRKKLSAHHKRSSSFVRDFDLIALQRELNSEIQSLQTLRSDGASDSVLIQQQSIVGSIESSLSSRKKAREIEDAKAVPTTAIELTENWGFVLKQPQTPQSPSNVTDGRERSRRPGHGGHGGLKLNIPPTMSDVSEESTDAESMAGTLPRKISSAASLNSGAAQSAESSSTGLTFRINVNISIASGSCLLLPVNVAQLPDDQRRHVMGQRKETLTNIQSHFAATNPEALKKKVSLTGSLLGGYSTPGRSSFGRRGGDIDMTKLDGTEVFIPGLLVQAHYHTDKEQLTVVSALSATSLSSTEELTPGLSASLTSHGDSGDKRRKRVRQISGSTTGRQTRIQKRGKMYVMLSMKSLPEQTVVRSCLLNFLEATMERVTVGTASSSDEAKADTNVVTDVDGDELAKKLSKSETSSESNATSGVRVSSLPVDVTLVLSIERQGIKLSGEPRSRLECLVRTPAIYMILSSSLLDAESGLSIDSSPGASDISSMPSKLSSPTKNISRQLSTVSAPRSTVCLTGYLSNFSVVLYHPLSEKAVLQQQSSSFSGAASTLSSIFNLNLDSLQINLSRRHMQDTSYFTHHLRTSPDDVNNVSSIQISAVCKLSLIDLLYDMRRTSDMEGFIKAWSNSTLFKRLVYGSSGNGEVADRLTVPQERAEDNARDLPSRTTGGQGSALGSAVKPWQSCMSLALKVSHLNVRSYIGPIMGETSFRSGPLNCLGSLTVDSSKRRNVQASIRLGTVDADSKSGAVGGLVNVDKAEATACVVTGKDCRVLHRVDGVLAGIKVRVDHLSSSVFMARLTGVRFHVTDKWSPSLSSGGCDVELLANVTWNDLELLISSSTSPSLVDSVRRIRKFVQQQRQNSRRALRGFASEGPRMFLESRTAAASERTDESSAPTDYRQHDHWTWVNDMQKFVCNFLGLDGHQSARLGGILVLEGDRFGLACLKGSHFRDPTWALFVLRQVKARYETVTIRGERALAVGKQSEMNLRSPVNAVSLQSFSIGLGNQRNSSGSPLMVQKVSRSRVAPITFNKNVDIDDWLDLMCRKESKLLSRLTNVATKAFEAHTIFAGPSFDLELNTSQYWSELGDWPVGEDDIPIVECNLTSSFRDSLATTTDIDLYLFLHDLIMSYRTELTATLRHGFSTLSTRETLAVSENETVRLRRFVCTNWQLNPHLKLLFWGGSGRINPHINWVLEKLGFKDARTTIPKWLQRGLLDPLDLTVSSLLRHIVHGVSHEVMTDM